MRTKYKRLLIHIAGMDVPQVRAFFDKYNNRRFRWRNLVNLQWCIHRELCRARNRTRAPLAPRGLTIGTRCVRRVNL